MNTKFYKPYALEVKRCRLFTTFFLIIFLFIYVRVNAQELSSQKNKTITGVVKDDTGETLPGVVVTIKSQNKGVSTNNDGSFTLSVPENLNILVFSYVGFQNQEVNIKNKTNIQVVLKQSTQSLNEVVVIGYGTSKREDLTGAISTFKPVEVDAQSFNTVDGLIRGRAAGVQVTQSGGDPGAAISVKIRGANSLRGDNEPLYVVDGIIISSVTSDAGDPFAPSRGVLSAQSRQSGLAGINPQDIETIEILKDASATAIYGSRGANGVVIITTKQGKGKPVISISSFTEFSQASKQLEMLDATGYASYINDLEASFNRPSIYGLDTLQNINWQKELQRTAVSNNSRITLTGSSLDNKTKYYFAGGYLNSVGIVENTGVKQGDLKMNFSQQVSPKFKMDFTLSANLLRNEATQGTDASNSQNSSMIIRMLTARPILNAQRSLDDPSQPYDNPLSWRRGYDDFAKEGRLISRLGLTYAFTKSFSYKVNLAVDYRTKERKIWYGKETWQGGLVNGDLGLSQYQRSYYQLESLFQYNKKINKSNSINGVLGVTYDDQNITNSSTNNQNFVFPELRTEGYGFGQIVLPYFRSREAAETFSVLGRVNYTFKDKYLLTASGRTDGTSKFADGNKFSFFPAVSAAWKLTNEPFLNSLKAISELKLRVGYGKSGSQAIGAYSTLSRYNSQFYVSGNVLVPGIVPVNIQNERLKWETTSQFNGGIDAGFINNRISFTVDVYHKLTDDLLQSFNLPGSAGFGQIVKNIGTVENKGLEISLRGAVIEKKNVSLNISGNIDFNRNKIIDLGLEPSTFGTYTNMEAYIGSTVGAGLYFKDAANIFAVGQPIGMFYGYKSNGVFQTGEDITTIKQFNAPVKFGDQKFVDTNNDGNINSDDKVILGNPNPQFNYGFNINLIVKKFNFNTFFNGVYGNQIANGNLATIGTPNGAAQNNILAGSYYNAWTPSNPSNSPRVGYNVFNFSDAFLENGSFLRFATATLGYTLSLKKTSVIKSVNINIAAKNLFTFTNYSGFDPEVNSFVFNSGRIGLDWGSYPNMRSYSLGLNFKL
jgi:TonB-linked SusC/RagA family outer membrane protein